VVRKNQTRITPIVMRLWTDPIRVDSCAELMGLATQKEKPRREGASEPGGEASFQIRVSVPQKIQKKLAKIFCTQ